MAITLEMRSSVMELYTAYFNRAADKDGVDYWVNEMDVNGWTIDQVAQSFADQEEYSDMYIGMTNAEIVAQVYTNVLNRSADAAGAEYWIEQLDNGDIQVKNLIQAVVAAAKEDVGGLGDDDIVANKTAVSQYCYDNNINLTDVSLAFVTADVASITDVTASIGATFTLTTDADVETANVFNSSNTFVAGTGYVNTLNDNDVLTGLGEDAELNVQIGASNDIDVDASIQPTLANIATVNVEFINDGDAEATLNLRDADGIQSVNVERITDNSAAANVTEMDASATSLSLNDATRAGAVTFSHKEEVLTGTSEELTFTANSARATALNLVEAGDGVADTGFYFETVNVTTTGNNDFDAMTIQANGREDLLLEQAANTTTQDINITANGTVATGSLEINSFTAVGAETIDIVANARVEIAADNEAALDDLNDGITTTDLETMTITGAADVMIDGLDSVKISNGTAVITDDKILTVDASTMTGDLKLGVATAADAQISDGTAVTGAARGDVDLSVTSGSGNDEIRTYGNLAGTITTNDGDDTVTVRTGNGTSAADTVNANIEGVSVISTGAGDDSVTVANMLAFGDTAPLNSDVDNAADIDTGAGNDTVTVAAMNSAINWDDNNPNDNNVDDLYSLVGASIQTGEGTDTLNISGAMAENTDVDTGAEVDTIVYTLAGLATALAGDTNSVQEMVAVDSSTEAVDASTLDLDGAVMLTGDGDDTLTFNDSDLPESATTLVAVGDTTRDGAGAKINMGAGTNDVFTLNTTDSSTVVGATVYTSTTSFNTAALITGVETMNLNILNSVDATTQTATGVAENETADMNNTAVTLDVMRVGSDLATLNLTSQEQALMTLTGSEQYESGDDTIFTVNNMRSAVTMTLTAFDATAVVGAANNAAAVVNSFADDGAITVDTQAMDATEIDTTLTINFQVSDADADNDAFAFTVQDGTYGDERDSGVEGYDLDLTLATTNQFAAWTTATSATDDNDLVIENLTLDIADSKNHLIDLNAFGDAQQTDARANQVNAVATSLIVTGSADNAKIDLYNVTADTITANLAADVDLYVGALSNKYTITTGSGNDNIDMTNDLVTANMTAVTGDESDTVAAGAGTDRLIINGGNDLLGVGTSSLEGDPFAQISGVEILRVDTDTSVVDSNDITLDDTAMATGISTLEIQGTGDQRIDLVLSDGFDRDLEIKSGTMTLAADNTAALDVDADNRYTARTAEATYLSIDSQDALLDTDTSNLTVTMGLEEGSELHFVNSGLTVSTVTVNVITANEAQATTILGLSDDENSTADLAAGSTYTTVGDQMLISKTTGGDIDVLNILEAESDDAILTDDDAAITVTVSDTWAATAMAINASTILDTDSNVATGGVTVDGSMEATAALTITGGANSDTLIGGNGSDTISGGAGNDTIVGDNTGLVVVEGTQGVQTVTFHDATSFEIGDTYTIVVGTNTYVYIAGDDKITVNGVATTVVAAANINTVGTIFATAINNANVDADADADVSAAYVAPVNPADGGVLTITGIDVAADNDVGTADLGETIVVTSSVAESVATQEVVTIDLNQTWDVGDVITINLGIDGDTDLGVEATVYTVTGAEGASIADEIAAQIVADVATVDTNDVAVATASGTTLTLTAANLDANATTGDDFFAAMTNPVVIADVGDTAQITKATYAGFTAGSVSITIGATTYSQIFNTSLAQTLTDFVTTHEAAIELAIDVQLSATATELVFTGDVVGDAGGFTVNAANTDTGTVTLATTQAANTDVDNTDITAVKTVLARDNGADATQEATQATVTAAVAALIGDSNVDTLNGGTGNDTLIGGGGADIIDGGEGTDTASYVNSSAAVTVSLALATAQVSTGEASGDVLTSIENLTGSAFADTLTGNSGVNVLTGNTGADTFVIGNTDSGVTLDTADTIADFTSLTDLLKLGTAGDATVGTGNLVQSTADYDDDSAGNVNGTINATEFATILTAANIALATLNTTSVATELYAVIGDTDTGNGYLFVDTDSNGTANEVIILTGTTAIAAADIIA